MKKILLLSAATLLVFASCGRSLDKTFEANAKEFTSQCPMMISDNTRADSAVYTKGDNTIRYYYALVGAVDNPSVARQVKSGLDQQLADAIKATDGLKIYREGGVTLEYIYRSATTQEEFFRIAVTPDMYE